MKTTVIRTKAPTCPHAATRRQIAQKIVDDGRIDAFVEKRYASFKEGIGADVVSGKATLESLSDYALSLNVVENKTSGAQEYLESVVNDIMFGGAL